MLRRDFLTLIASAPIAALAPLPSVLPQSPLALKAGLCGHCGFSLAEGRHGMLKRISGGYYHVTCEIPPGAESPCGITVYGQVGREYWYNSWSDADRQRELNRLNSALLDGLFPN